MRGPYAQFNMEEVKEIYRWALAEERALVKNVGALPVGQSYQQFLDTIKSKCESAINADPRLRQPMKELPAQEIRDAMQ